MKKIRQFFCFYSLPLFSAVLMAFSYIPCPPYAVFFCYVPLWLFALRQKKIGTILLGSWLCQFLATLLGFHWLAYTFREFGFFSWPMSLVGLFGFACFANLHISIALGLWFLSQKLLNPKKVVAPFVMRDTLILLPIYSALAMEYYPMIFEWHWGYTWFYAGWPAGQTAEIWGFKFLNTLTLLFNSLVLFGFLLWTKVYRKKALWVLGGGLIVFMVLNIQGLYLKHRWPKPNQTAQVLIVQPNIKNLHWQAQKFKRDPRALALKQLIEETHLFFTDPALAPPDFILWPEGAYPYSIRHYRGSATANFVSQKAREWQTPILLSAIGESPQGTTNSLFAFDKEGGLIQAPYDKTLLLVFGEYLPGEKWFNWGKWLSYYGRSFKRGTGEHKTMSLKNYRLGFQICYESLFDFFTRDLAREEANILVNVTNDSWYGRGFEPYQHLYMTLARAIEVRRPLIRGTNTGFSAVISAKGEILKKSALYKRDSWIQTVPYYSGDRQTLWTKGGYYINTCFLWFSLCVLWAYLFLRRKNLKILQI